MTRHQHKQQDEGPVETWPVAQSSALAAAVRVAMHGAFEGRYGYVVIDLNGVDIRISVFTEHEQMLRALTREYTRGSRWQFPLSTDQVLVFTPVEAWLLPKTRRADA